MKTHSSVSYGKTIRHTHQSTWTLGGGLDMTTKRIGTDERANLRLDVYDSCDPTAILIVTSGEGEPDDLDRAALILNHEQVAALVKAGTAFLEQYPHGIESARRRDRGERGRIA